MKFEVDKWEWTRPGEPNCRTVGRTSGINSKVHSQQRHYAFLRVCELFSSTKLNYAFSVFLVVLLG